MASLPKSLARALASSSKSLKPVKRQTSHKDGTRTFECVVCSTAMRKDDTHCTNAQCENSLDYRPHAHHHHLLAADARKRGPDATAGNEPKKSKSSSDSDAAAALSTSVRVSAAALASSKLSLKSMYEVVEAATDAPTPRCAMCKLTYTTPQPPSTSSSSSPSTDAATSPSPVTLTNDHTPRILSCGHSFCFSCLHSQLVLNASFIACSTCSSPHPMPALLLGDTGRPSSPTEFLSALPLNHALVDMLEGHRHLLRHLREFATNTERMCAAAAAAASVIEVGPSSVDEITQLELEVALHEQKVKQKEDLHRRRQEQLRKEKEKDEEAQIQAAAGAAAEAARAKRVAAAVAKAAASASRKAVATDSESASSFSSKSDGDERGDEEDHSDVEMKEDASSVATATTASATGTGTVTTSSRPSTSGWGAGMAHSLITPCITAAQRSRLQTWLGPEVDLRRARLLYQGSRDGWRAEHFFGRCSNKGPTLLLVKVAGCENVFGSFTVVPWFRPPATASATSNANANATPVPASALFSNVYDRSYRSFLFSLRNASGHPFRLTLSSGGPAIVAHPTLGPMFGGKVKGLDGANLQWPNITLCCEGRLGTHPQGNVANDPAGSNCAYQVEEDPRHPPPPGFECNQDTLAGYHYFAMEEFECYSLHVPGISR